MTRAPTARSRRAAARPLLPRPTTTTRRPALAPKTAPPRATTSASFSGLTPLAPRWGSSQLQGAERQQRQRERDDPEAHDDLRLRPTLQLVVVMERRHTEDPPPGELEGRHLDDDRHRLHHVEPADERQQQLGL